MGISSSQEVWENVTGVGLQRRGYEKVFVGLRELWLKEEQKWPLAMRMFCRVNENAGN